jgi:hypothetical protein
MEEAMDGIIAMLAQVEIEEVAEELYGPSPELLEEVAEPEFENWEGTEEYDG